MKTLQVIDIANILQQEQWSNDKNQTLLLQDSCSGRMLTNYYALQGSHLTDKYIFW